MKTSFGELADIAEDLLTNKDFDSLSDLIEELESELKARGFKA